MIPLQKITAEQLSRLVGSEQHQGIACKVKSLPMMELEELIAAPQKPNLVALDQVQDPMNLGAILRSANAFGIGAIICPKDHSAPLREAAIKASAGAALHTPVIYVTNLARAMEELKDAGYWIVAMMAPETSEEVGEHGWAKGAAIHHHRLQKSGPLPLSQLTPATPWVLLAGSEGKGIRPLVARGADYKAFIPMNQGQAVVESLNVSAACAVALYALSQSTAMDD
jgi:23S rRNA (guanosine2251-2'-O)-methyltransferase